MSKPGIGSKWSFLYSLSCELRFGLALECSNIEAALEAAKGLDDKECWEKLGVPVTQHWSNNSTCPVDHILAGNVESACRLLHDQVGVVDFSPYKPHLTAALSCSRSRVTCLPPLPLHPPSNWKEASPKTALPAVGLRLGDLVTRLQAAYHLTTSGKFSEAIDKFRAILLSIPLLVVETKVRLSICCA